METQQSKSKLILDELRRRGTREKIVDVEEETIKVVIFSLLNETYAFNGPEVKEILPLLPVYYVPGSPDFIPGVINVRGDIESVININRLLGLPDSKPSPKSRIAIVDIGGLRSGIIVDVVEEVIDIPASFVKPPLSTLNKTVREYVAGELMFQDRTVTILDMGKIFGRLGS
jgi:purine-binding chemotaxis protein CheW